MTRQVANRGRNQGKPSLILVDDEPDITEILTVYLEKSFAITSYNDPRAALADIEENAFDLMITDIRMPRLDGNELLKRSKAIQPELVVIQTTGHATSRTEISVGNENGCSGLLRKPFGSNQNVIDFIARSAPGLLGHALEPKINGSHIPLHSLSLPKALIIDDDADLAEVLSAFLEADFETKIVTNPGDILPLLQRERFDIIVTDLAMPGFSGTDVIRAAAQLDFVPKLVVSTGFDNQAPAVQQAIASGIDGIITKPFSRPAEVLDVLNAALKKNH